MTTGTNYRDIARARIFSVVCKMKPGQRVRFDAMTFRDAFPTHPILEPRPPVDQFLEKMPGANYGAWTCRVVEFEDYYEVACHEPGEKRVRQDYDRRHIPLPGAMK